MYVYMYMHMNMYRYMYEYICICTCVHVIRARAWNARRCIAAPHPPPPRARAGRQNKHAANEFRRTDVSLCVMCTCSTRARAKRPASCRKSILTDPQTWIHSRWRVCLAGVRWWVFTRARARACTRICARALGRTVWSLSDERAHPRRSRRAPVGCSPWRIVCHLHAGAVLVWSTAALLLSPPPAVASRSVLSDASGSAGSHRRFVFLLGYAS